jgi:hypothetical protein
MPNEFRIPPATDAIAQEIGERLVALCSLRTDHRSGDHVTSEGTM